MTNGSSTPIIVVAMPVRRNEKWRTGRKSRESIAGIIHPPGGNEKPNKL
jgi:hypothetical protein